MIKIEASSLTTVLVCVTCRIRDDTRELSESGLLLAQATAVAAAGDANICVQHICCLGNCSRGPSAAIRREHGWTYIFGQLDPRRDGQTLVTGARLLSAASDGLMPWRGRPDALKRGLIARVPPVDFQPHTHVRPA